MVLAASSPTAAAGSGRRPDPVESSTAAALRRGGRVFVATATGSPVFELVPRLAGTVSTWLDMPPAFELVPRLAGAGSLRARGFVVLAASSSTAAAGSAPAFLFVNLHQSLAHCSMHSQLLSMSLV